MNTRDKIVLKKIIQYADEINETIYRFNLTSESFAEDFVVRNAISMCILQIGELVGKLSDEFKRLLFKIYCITKGHLRMPFCYTFIGL